MPIVNSLAPIFLRLEHTRIAKEVSSSLALTAGLSAVHLIGFTLIMSGALLSNLRLAGALFAVRPLSEIRRPAQRAMIAGLLVSAVTGTLLFSPRASEASRNTFFEIKMAALAAACLCQFVLQRFVVAADRSVAARAVGVVGVLLWLTLAIAAGAFVLLD
jgi:hypothetical protein